MCKPSQSVKQAKLNKQNIENTLIVGICLLSKYTYMFVLIIKVGIFYHVDYFKVIFFLFFLNSASYLRFVHLYI